MRETLVQVIKQQWFQETYEERRSARARARKEETKEQENELLDHYQLKFYENLNGAEDLAVGAGSPAPYQAQGSVGS